MNRGCSGMRSRGEIECSEMHVAIQGAYTDVMLGEYGLATNLKSTILVFKKNDHKIQLTTCGVQ